MVFVTTRRARSPRKRPPLRVPAVFAAVIVAAGVSSLGALPSASASASASEDSSGAAPAHFLVGDTTELNNPLGSAIGPDETLYVANYSSDSITLYAAGADGDSAPIGNIGGPATGLDGPSSISIDSVGTVYVANETGNTVSAFAPGSAGNVAPVRVITVDGDDPGPRVFDLAVDPEDHLYVSGAGTNDGVAVYAADAKGNDAPIREVGGTLSGPYVARGIAVDDEGQLYVAVDSSSSIAVFAADAAVNDEPIRSLSGDTSKIFQPTDLVVGGDGEIAVIQDDSVLRFGPGADGDTAPDDILRGVTSSRHGPSELPGVQAITVDDSGTLFVTDPKRNTITSIFSIPEITGAWPNFVAASGGGTLRLSGTGFGEDAEVTIDGVPATTRVRDATSITITVPDSSQVDGQFPDFALQVTTGGLTAESAVSVNYVPTGLFWLAVIGTPLALLGALVFLVVASLRRRTAKREARAYATLRADRRAQAAAEREAAAVDQ